MRLSQSRGTRDYRPSEILDVCAIYVSGLLRTLALNLTHCEEPFMGVALSVLGAE